MYVVRSYKHELQAARKELEEKWRTQESLHTHRDRLKELEQQVTATFSMILIITCSFKRNVYVCRRL